MAFFKNKIAGIVNNSYMKVIILLIFAIYLCGAAYGITQIKEGLERRKLSKEDSYSVKFFDLEDEYYREFPYRMQVIVAQELDYSNKVSALCSFSFTCSPKVFGIEIVNLFVSFVLNRPFKINTRN